MKFILQFALVLGAYGATLHDKSTPITKVVLLLQQMQMRIEGDGKNEQMSYDRYACWVEATLDRKAKDIENAKKQIKALQARIIELEGEIGSHEAEVAQLKKDIAENLESQKEARSVRTDQNSNFEDDKTELEQCIGALEAAIKTLTDGTKSNFLETMKEVQLLSVVAGVKSALQRSSVSRTMPAKDLAMINNFIHNPDEFVKRRNTGVLSAMQYNPFGDYAPQSTQIQGILRGMYEAFTRDLENNNGQESDAQRKFEALMQTKEQELNTLKASLSSHENDLATKTAEKDEKNELMDKTKVQLEADEKFFAETKATGQMRAEMWSNRSNLRAQELAGIAQAIDVLNSPEAIAIFTNATRQNFLQLSSVSSSHIDRRSMASTKMARLSQELHSHELAQLAVEIQSTGHFDNIIVSIDKMIAYLREEEQDDIAHRDRCQRADDKNVNAKADINLAITKAGQTIGQLNTEKTQLEGQITQLGLDIAGTQTQMGNILSLRNTAVADYREEVEDDTQAIALLDQAMVHLSRFYRDNRIPMSLVQNLTYYTVDNDTAPRWEGKKGPYGGNSEETHGIVEILKMVKEDLEKEIQTSHADNDVAEAQYEKERAALQDTLNSQRSLKVSTEQELDDVERAILAHTNHKNKKTNELSVENDVTTEISTDCAWVATNFDTRRTKRKKEIEGLVDAKGYLAGADDGSLV